MEPTLNWEAARQDTLNQWLKIREMAREPDELELLTEINTVCELCDVAEAADPEVFGRCERCLVYQQFGGCRGINAEMSERIVEHDFEGLLVLIDRFIGNLRALRVPPTPA
jgi:hypothetical protein